MKRVWHRVWVLAAMLACACGVCAAPTDAKSPPKPSANSKAEIPALPNLNFSLPPLSQFQEIIERPLFMPDRKPQPPEAQAQATSVAPANPPQARLLGTIITPDKRQALIEDALTAKVVRLEQGQPLQDWQVQEIKPDRVLLGRAGQPQSQELLLRVYNEAQPGAPGTDPAQVAAAAQAAAQAAAAQAGLPQQRLPGMQQHPMPQQVPPVQRRILQRRYDPRTPTR